MMLKNKKFYNFYINLFFFNSRFVKLVLTYTDSELRSIVTQRPPYKVRRTDYLSREIENELLTLLKLEFNLIQEFYAKTESLKYLFGFDIRRSFEFIDKYGFNYLDENNLCEFIKNNFNYVSINDSHMLVKRLDLDNDGKVGFSDYLFYMQLGKNNKINNSTKLNRLNYSLPNFDLRNSLDKNNSILNKSLFNYEDENQKYNNFNEKAESSSNNLLQKNNNFKSENIKDDYGNLSYRKGEDPDIDTLRFNTSGFNFNPARKGSNLEMNNSEDRNLMKNSLTSFNHGK